MGQPLVQSPKSYLGNPKDSKLGEHPGSIQVPEWSLWKTIVLLTCYLLAGNFLLTEVRHELSALASSLDRSDKCRVTLIVYAMRPDSHVRTTL